MFSEKRKRIILFSFLGILTFSIFGIFMFVAAGSGNDEILRATPTLPSQFVFVTLTPEVTPPKCGGPEQMYILLVGSDRAEQVIRRVWRIRSVSCVWILSSRG